MEMVGQTYLMSLMKADCGKLFPKKKTKALGIGSAPGALG
jgi:hypothetical protein